MNNIPKVAKQKEMPRTTARRPPHYLANLIATWQIWPPPYKCITKQMHTFIYGRGARLRCCSSRPQQNHRLCCTPPPPPQTYDNHRNFSHWFLTSLGGTLVFPRSLTQTLSGVKEHRSSLYPRFYHNRIQVSTCKPQTNIKLIIAKVVSKERQRLL